MKDDDDIRKQIATEILETGWLIQQCRAVCHNRSLADDLMGEILLIVLEYQPDSALDIAHANNKHLPLIRKIITNQFQSTSSDFYRKYRRQSLFNVELNEDTFNIEDERGYYND